MWLKIDDGFMRHGKIVNLSDKAFRLHMAGMCFCAANLTDGALNGRAVRIVCAELDVRRPKPLLDELIDGDLWLPTGDGYLVKDFLDYNPPAEQARELKRARAEAGRLGGIRSGQSRRGEATAEANASKQQRSTLLEPRPVPSRKDLKTLGEHALFSLDRVTQAAAKAASTGTSAA